MVGIWELALHDAPYGKRHEMGEMELLSLGTVVLTSRIFFFALFFFCCAAEDLFS